MGLFSSIAKALSGDTSEEETHHPVYEQPIVHRDPPVYDHNAKPTAAQESVMLDFALGHDRDGAVDALADEGWLYGRNGWVKRA
jgi:hypothetical protein